MMKKRISLLIVMIMLFTMFQNTVLGAAKLESADLINGSRSETDVQFGGPSKWASIEANCIFYEGEVRSYPVYSLIREENNATTVRNRKVNITEKLQEKKSDDINYTQVWRTIVNGYPYKSPEDLGVESMEQAYFVTQQAIYCVMSNCSMSLYRGISETGDMLIEAIQKLKNTGLYGTQMPPKVDLQIVSKGQLTQEKEHYSQVYEVKANVDIEEYSVNVGNLYKKGIFIANMNGDVQETFQAGKTFKVMIPNAQIDEKTNIDVMVSAKCKTYPTYYGVATDIETQDYALTDSAYENVSKSVPLVAELEKEEETTTNEQKTGNLKVITIDEETKMPIEGIDIELTDLKGNIIQTVTTDKRGEAFFQNLIVEEYQLREANTKQEYEMGEKMNIFIQEEKTTEVIMQNKKKPVTSKEEQTTLPKEDETTSPKEETITSTNTKTESTTLAQKEVKKLPKTGF